HGVRARVRDSHSAHSAGIHGLKFLDDKRLLVLARSLISKPTSKRLKPTASPTAAAAHSEFHMGPIRPTCAERAAESCVGIGFRWLPAGMTYVTDKGGGNISAQ